MRGVVMAALLAASLLAGCSGGASGEGPSGSVGTIGENKADPVAGADFGDLKATKKTGVLRGVVIDAAIRPILKASVEIIGPNGNTTEIVTGETGSFGLDGLEPGAYAVRATKLGYHPAETTTVVVAGKSDPDILKLTLLVDEATKPFAQILHFEGYIECSGTFVAVGFAACSAANIPTNIVCALTGTCVGRLTQDQFSVTYNLTRPPTFLQSELIWQSTQAAGNKLALMYSYGNCGGFYCDHEVAGTSPLVLQADASVIETIGVGNGTDLFIRVFNQGVDESQGRLGLTLQQKFDIYTIAFYGYLPPEGWTFHSGQPVPQPE